MSEPTPECWQPVEGFPNYEVSDQGRVRSLRSNCVLKPVVLRGRYFAVDLSRGKRGSAKLVYVHKLVAEAFIGARPPGLFVRHGPNGTFDNRASQLCYGTRIANEDDKRRDGTLPAGEQHYIAKLTESIVAECRVRVAAGEQVASLAKAFGVSGPTMDAAVTGRTWRNCEVPPVPRRPGSPYRKPARLPDAVVADCRARYLAGESAAALAAEFAVHRNTMYHALRSA